VRLSSGAIADLAACHPTIGKFAKIETLAEHLARDDVVDHQLVRNRDQRSLRVASHAAMPPPKECRNELIYYHR
jgi:hypothetical protein